ncbi:glycosyltransferase family 4 protein [Rhizomonospora bruguierae]|uniref:glycosyltransferase family 4 protein n=1 Tax=Rhizomonospora bruguierae TaxID=1581705 RepID=UPI001BCCDBAB|nr:glycosyltransferase family 4 protein [Micromonospora sp. NBRC 107566]
MKILFLIGDAFGIGGTIRTTFNLARALAARHEVEIVSMFRRRDVPHLALDPAVRLMSLVEVRENHPDFARDDPRRGRPPRVFPPGEFRRRDYDLLVERRAEAYLRGSDADVVIATRAGLIAFVARFAPDRMIRIGQEHLTRAINPPSLRLAMARHYQRLDAFVTVSAADAEDYRRHLRLRRTRLLFIPNSVPAPPLAPSDGRQELIVAAGRLVRSKRYDVLIRAFAKVVAERPRWRLRLYGAGEQSADLRALVQELGLYNSVLLMGPHQAMESEWAKGSIAAVTSDKEPFGMTLVEAMRCGTPVVSTDAPHGPAEILSDGVDGRLVPPEDVDAVAGALLELINDPAGRSRMAAAALRTGERYDPAAVADRYERLFGELAEAKGARARTGAGRMALAVAPMLGVFATLRGTAGALRRREPGARVGFARRPDERMVFGPAPQGGLLTADCAMSATDTVVLRLPAGVTGRIVCVDGAVEHAVDAAPETPLTLPDGTWLVFHDGSGHKPGGGGGREPVLAGVRDTRPLLDQPGDRVAVALPHRRKDAQLAIRVWRRARHAEVGDVQVSDGSVTVTGRLIGTDLGGAPAVVLRAREEPAVTRRVPARATGGAGFTAEIRYGPLVERRWVAHDAWDAFLATPAGEVRLARLLDDVFDKKAAYAYPATPVGAARVRPYYTDGNGFSLLVSGPVPGPSG